MEEELLTNTEVKKHKIDVKKEIFEWVKSLIISLIAVALIITFVGEVRRVKNISMLPTFVENDRIITTKIHGELKRGDVVVIKQKDDKPLIKRVIAVAGETININFENGDVFINDKLIDEPYINEKTRTNYGTEFPLTIKKGHVFVMGDNRNQSMDSRDTKIGAVDTRNVFGKVIFRIYPFNKIGTIK